MVLSDHSSNLTDIKHSLTETQGDHPEFKTRAHRNDLKVRAAPSRSPSSTKNRSGSHGKFTEDWNTGERGTSIIEQSAQTMERSEVFPGAVVETMDNGITLPSRSGTLKKTPSIKRDSSFKRNGSRSRRGSTAASMRDPIATAKSERPVNDMQNVYHCPIPFSGDPTDTLANRFSAWRKVLKDLITYFREIQSHYEHRAKANIKIANVANNTQSPSTFLMHGGIDDALSMLKIYHKDSIGAANRARDIENDVILALTGLRTDLSGKIKEIKSLSGDFKNSVEKEMSGTRRAVDALSEALRLSEHEQASKQDPLLLRMAADRQVERQIDEENYLQQAYLNLEQSGRELEAIVVGEIQKSYNAYAGILKREAEEAMEVVTALKGGPITMAKDKEWNSFIKNDNNNFIDPALPMRHAEHVHYPGRDSELAIEVRAGLLERKSKYLKSYTPGWYVLSPTYLHEFKSADKTQAPIMSLHLPEQKLGSHSDGSGSSNKFILKGKQTGGMHRGHTWIFRAESHDTMMAWYQAIKTLTESAPQERSAFVRQHARSVSGFSQRSKAGSISSDGALDEDEDDEPFSAANSQSAIVVAPAEVKAVRPQPGGRFPSDLQLNTQRNLQAPLSPSSESSDFKDQFHNKDVIAATGPSGNGNENENEIGQQYGVVNSPTYAAELNQMVAEDGVNPYSAKAIDSQDAQSPLSATENYGVTNSPGDGRTLFASAAAGLGGLNLGTGNVEAQQDHNEQQPRGLERIDSTSGEYAQGIFPGAVPYSAAAIALQEQAAREAEAIATPGDSYSQYLHSSDTQSTSTHQNATAFHNASIAALESHPITTEDKDVSADGQISPETEAFPSFVSGAVPHENSSAFPKSTFPIEAHTMSPDTVGHDSHNPDFVPLEAGATPSVADVSNPVEAKAQHSYEESSSSRSQQNGANVVQKTVTDAANEAQGLRSNLAGEPNAHNAGSAVHESATSAANEAQELRSSLVHGSSKHNAVDPVQETATSAANEAQTLRSTLVRDSKKDHEQRPPTLGEVRQFASTSTISNLHVPGEFPKERSNKGTVYDKLPV